MVNCKESLSLFLLKSRTLSSAIGRMAEKRILSCVWQVVSSTKTKGQFNLDDFWCIEKSNRERVYKPWNKRLSALLMRESLLALICSGSKVKVMERLVFNEKDFGGCVEMSLRQRRPCSGLLDVITLEQFHAAVSLPDRTRGMWNEPGPCQALTAGWPLTPPQGQNLSFSSVSTRAHVCLVFSLFLSLTDKLAQKSSVGSIRNWIQCQPH